MVPLQPKHRGRINELTYGWDLRRWVDDAVVTRIADELIRQRFFISPVESYYEAAAAALESGARVTEHKEDNEEVARDLLIRLLQALDARRPWPEHPFATLGAEDWPALRDAPAIARIPLSQRDVQHRLHRIFSEIPPGIGEVRVLVLRLRTGQVVALLARPPFTEPGIDLLAHADPASTVAAFRELTGIDVEPR